MSLSVADIYEDYLESKKTLQLCISSRNNFIFNFLHFLGLQNLPSEIDQNMHELRRMDDDLQSIYHIPERLLQFKD